MSATAESPAKARGKARKPAAAPSAAKLAKVRDAAQTLKQLGDATRLHILLLLAERERNVGQICEALAIASQPAVSHHLSLMRFGGLVQSRRSGKNNIYELCDKGRALARVAAEMVG